jgi:predicted esterase
MPQTLIAFHGLTQNGAALGASMVELAARLAPDTAFVYPDAPHACPEASALSLFGTGWFDPPTRPWLRWWDASDDGRVYHGLDATLEVVKDVLSRHPGAGILGFSQGGILAAAVAGLSQLGELPPIPYAILVAGRVPRADALAPGLATSISVPSLHVWGERDPFGVNHPLALVDRFDPATRTTCLWEGSHAIPTRGPASDVIVDFVRRHATG